MLLLPRGTAHGGHVPAVGRVLAGARRRCHRDVDARHVPGVQPPAGPRLRRPVQGVLRRRRRHRLVGGRRAAGRQPALRRPPRRPPRPRGGTRHRCQPGRRLQRPHRAERPLPAARHPHRAHQRRNRRVRGGRGGGTRHRHLARRPDRGAGAAGHLRTGPARGPAAVAGLGQVEPGAHPGRGRCHGRAENGARPASRTAAEDAVRREALVPRGLVLGRRGTARPGTAVAARGATETRRRLLLRHQRHERPRHPGGGPRRSRPCPGRTGGSGRTAAGRALDAVHQAARDTAQARGPAALVTDRAPRHPAIGHRPHAGHRPRRFRTPRRGPGVGPRLGGQRPGDTHNRRHQPARRPGHGTRRNRTHPGTARIRLLGPGRSAGRDGPGAGGDLPRVRGCTGRGVRGLRRAAGPSAA